MLFRLTITYSVTILLPDLMKNEVFAHNLIVYCQTLICIKFELLYFCRNKRTPQKL